MIETEIMKKYEAETGEEAVYTEFDEWLIKDVYIPTSGYVDWLSAKAEAYDRLMSDGKKTLKEWANIFGMAVAVDKNGEVTCFEHIPVMYHDKGEGIWTNSSSHYGEEIYLLPPHLIDFEGDWKDSLTLPDGWEETK